MRHYSIKDGSQLSLSIAALGIVYGDIGTSPLYALRVAMSGLVINTTNVLGVLSLIFWSLIIIISIKYLWVVFSADNEGEGGILALLALLKRSRGKNILPFLYIVGIFGAGLMFGDGMLTPAISVVSAVEGLDIAIPTLSNVVIPVSMVILLALFFVQRKGTGKIGFVFGPIIFFWFLTIGILGLLKVIENPLVFNAINPLYAIEFFHINGWQGYAVLGGVFLVVTGGEALYADMGHLGKKPIRISWFLIALPCLLLNYFGQGANLLMNPLAIKNPFYLMAPEWFSLPLLIIATIATIIASQAVISATFSLTRQAILLGLYPHLPIHQTSKVKRGQIYIPQMNFILGLGALLLIFYFQSSSNLAGAYGININMDMALTTIMIAILAYRAWHLPLPLIIGGFIVLISIDLLFLGANLQKISTGGWIPLSLAALCAFVMNTWKKGMQVLRENFYMKKDDLSRGLKLLRRLELHPLPNIVAIFISDFYDRSGGSFVQFLKLSRTIPEHVLLLNYEVKNVPYVSTLDRYHVTKLDKNICKLTLRYGFMDYISLPQALYVANEMGILPFAVDVKNATYLIEIPNIVASPGKRTLSFYWEERLFSFLLRNYSANFNVEFYQLPFNRTVAMGAYFII